MLEKERFEKLCKAAGPVPRFGSDWTRQMSDWLRSKQCCFDGAHEWADWLCKITEDICESWMDRQKAQRPKGVLLDCLDEIKGMLDEVENNPRYYQRCKRRIQESVRCWSTGTMEERVVICLERTWQAIGMDVLACGGEDPEQVVMNAEEIRDAVSSCGLGKGSYVDSYGGDRRAIEWLGSQSHEKQDELLAKAFPAGNYGM